MDLTALKDFIDLGSTAILAIGLLYIYFRCLSGMNEKLTKVLTLLAILTKTVTNFNGVDKVLGKDGEKVAETIIKAEAEHDIISWYFLNNPFGYWYDDIDGDATPPHHHGPYWL